MIKLNWVEQRGADFFSIPMTFKVTDVVIAPKAWSVHASFTNRSQKTVRISRKSTSASARYSFGLGAPTVTSQPGVVYTQLEQLDATYAKPRFPMQLRPGRSWTGVFGGPGVPPKRKLVNVTFGIFSAAGEVKEWSWVTDHAFKL